MLTQDVANTLACSNLSLMCHVIQSDTDVCGRGSRVLFAVPVTRTFCVRARSDILFYFSASTQTTTLNRWRHTDERKARYPLLNCWSVRLARGIFYIIFYILVHLMPRAMNKKGSSGFGIREYEDCIVFQIRVRSPSTMADLTIVNVRIVRPLRRWASNPSRQYCHGVTCSLPLENKLRAARQTVKTTRSR